MRTRGGIPGWGEPDAAPISRCDAVRVEATSWRVSHRAIVQTVAMPIRKRTGAARASDTDISSEQTKFETIVPR
jgi:hypothetical protein